MCVVCMHAGMCACVCSWLLLTTHQSTTSVSPCCGDSPVPSLKSLNCSPLDVMVKSGYLQHSMTQQVRYSKTCTANPQQLSPHLKLCKSLSLSTIAQAIGNVQHLLPAQAPPVLMTV
jgi:hypothetical protein